MSIFDPHKTLILPRGYPWLAASLSWLLPGAGHLYCGAYLRGIGCFLLFCLFGAILGSLLISGYLADGLAVGLSFLVPKFFRAAASADAFQTTRRLHSVDIESMRGPAQRAYFPVFLTSLVPGLGQLHERRWRSHIGFLFLCLYLWLVPVSLASLAGKAGVLILRSLACAMLFSWARVKRTIALGEPRGSLPVLLQRRLWVATRPGQTRRTFLVENLIWNGNSMMPTVPHGSHCSSGHDDLQVQGP